MKQYWHLIKITRRIKDSFDANFLKMKGGKFSWLSFFCGLLFCDDYYLFLWYKSAKKTTTIFSYSDKERDLLSSSEIFLDIPNKISAWKTEKAQQTNFLFSSHQSISKLSNHLKIIQSSIINKSNLQSSIIKDFSSIQPTKIWTCDSRGKENPFKIP